MSESELPADQMRLVLTPEQQEMVRRMSGQNIEAIELTPEDTKKGGGPLRFCGGSRRQLASRASGGGKATRIRARSWELGAGSWELGAGS